MLIPRVSESSLLIKQNIRNYSPKKGKGRAKPPNQPLTTTRDEPVHSIQSRVDASPSLGFASNAFAYLTIAIAKLS